MSNSVFFPLAALCAVLMIAFAAVYPQGIGARSPGPFGHETAAHQAARTKKPPKSATAPGEQIVLHEPL
jgi:hypothetical protein